MVGRWSAALGILAVTLAACAKKEQPQSAAAPAGPAKGTPEWKIQNAMSAAPTAIASAATIVDWPSAPGGQPAQLKAGTNGWTCFPDNPPTPGNDPMCYDGVFGAWATAWMSHKTPNITAFGTAYMLQGGTDASNSDPFKMAPDSGQPWVDTGPHVMVVVPSVNALKSVSTDYRSGGPYIMWQGTPYAHVMIPVRGGASPMAAGAMN